jgi:hypothetical protein
VSDEKIMQTNDTRQARKPGDAAFVVQVIIANLINRYVALASRVQYLLFIVPRNHPRAEIVRRTTEERVTFGAHDHYLMPLGNERMAD